MIFYIEISGSDIYDKIMESLISRSLTHSKDILHLNRVSLEIQGSRADYLHFKELIDNINIGKEYPLAIIIEGI